MFWLMVLASHTAINSLVNNTDLTAAPFNNTWRLELYLLPRPSKLDSEDWSVTLFRITLFVSLLLGDKKLFQPLAYTTNLTRPFIFQLAKRLPCRFLFFFYWLSPMPLEYSVFAWWLTSVSKRITEAFLAFHMVSLPWHMKSFFYVLLLTSC